MIILVLVIGMILTFVGGYQIAEKHMLAAGRPGAGEFTLPPAEPEKAYHNCAVSTERVFEERMVEAELMRLDEMTVCEDKKCENCQPSRDFLRARRKAEESLEKIKSGIEERKSFHEHFVAELEARKHRVPLPSGTMQWGSLPDPARRTPRPPRPPRGPGGGSKGYTFEEERKRKFKELASKQSSEARNLTREIDGRLVPVPNNVPKRAEAYLAHDPNGYLIVWTWTDDGSPHGRPMVIKQFLYPESFNALPRVEPKIVAKSYKHGAVKDLDMLLCPPCDSYDYDQKTDYTVRINCRGCGAVHHIPAALASDKFLCEECRYDIMRKRAPRIGTERTKK